MADDPQIPNVGAIIGPGIDRLVQVRPSAAPFVESGRYGDVIAGWRGQFELERKRLAEEVAASRLTGEGPALTELAKSEFDTERQGALAAVGEVLLARKVVHAVASSPSAIATPTDQASCVASVTAFITEVQTHAIDVFSPSAGLGAHVVADLTTDYSIGTTATLSQIVFTGNRYKQSFLTHLANAGGWHKDTDATTAAALTAIPDATAAYLVAGGPDTWANATPASQQSIQRMIAGCSAALLAHAALEARAGTIRVGTRVVLSPNPAAVPAVLGANYVVAQDTVIGTAVQFVAPPLDATKTGPSSNVPAWQPTQAQTITVAPLFDAGATLHLLPVSLRAAGGSAGQADTTLRRAAKAAWTGRYGPTVGAIVAGTLKSSGIAHAAVREDSTGGPAAVYAADETWAQSTRLLARLQQDLADNWLGFGERVKMGLIVNQLVRLDLTVALRDARSLSDTSGLTTAIQKKLRAYFDERPDFWTWRLSAIRGVVSRADRRLLACSIAIVRDGAGIPLTEPAALPIGTIVHYWLADNPVNVTYTAPS